MVYSVVTVHVILSTSHIRRQQTKTPINYSWRPCKIAQCLDVLLFCACSLLLCHALWHPPVHLLWCVPRPGINCRCTYEHGRQLARSRPITLSRCGAGDRLIRLC